MSGFAGCFHFEDSKSKADCQYLGRLGHSIEHRGEAGQADWISESGSVGVAFRDAAAQRAGNANQPAFSSDGSLVVVFDGTIYNAHDIKQELLASGNADFSGEPTQYDIVAQALRVWGIEALTRFRGVFAIAFWDEREKALWLIRDRVGAKHLYFRKTENKIVFANELKAILADPECPIEIEEEALYHYMTFQASPAPLTFLKSISKLQSSSWLRVDTSGNVKSGRYWDVFDDLNPRVNVSHKDLSESLIAKLRDSVKAASHADTPVGVLLSGGVDSSVNAKLLSEESDQPVKSFTAGYAGDYDPTGEMNRKGASYANEIDYARMMAERSHITYCEKMLTMDEVIEGLPKMIWHLDEPVADPGAVPLFFLGQLAHHEGVAAFQSGEGADGLFLGTAGAQKLRKLQHLDGMPIPRAFKALGLSAMQSMGKSDTFAYERLRRTVNNEAVFWSGGETFTHEQKLRILSPRLREQFKGFSSWEAVRDIRTRFEDRAWEKSPLAWMTYVDLNLRFPDWLLMRIEKMAMASGVEARFPFLDHHFIQFMMSIPEVDKVGDGTLKYLFKMGARGLIPDDIIDRPKQGLGLPVHEWFFDKLGDVARESLKNFCAQTDLYDLSAVEALAQRREADHAHNTRQYYALMNVALWWDGVQENSALLRAA